MSTESPVARRSKDRTTIIGWAGAFLLILFLAAVLILVAHALSGLQAFDHQQTVNQQSTKELPRLIRQIEAHFDQSIRHAIHVAANRITYKITHR